MAVCCHCLLLRWCCCKEAWKKSLRRIRKHIVVVVFFSNGVAEKKAMATSCHCLLCSPLRLTRRRWWPFSCVHVKKVMTTMVVIDFIFWSLCLRKRKRWQQLHWCLPPKKKFGFFEEEGDSFSLSVYMVLKAKGTQVLRALCLTHLFKRMCGSLISLNVFISLQDCVNVFCSSVLLYSYWILVSNFNLGALALNLQRTRKDVVGRS
jgi:hypothetical protein